MVRSSGRREILRYPLGRYGVSLRRDCAQARISRSLYGYRSREAAHFRIDVML